MKQKCIKLAKENIKYWLKNINKDLNQAFIYGLEVVNHFLYCGYINEKQASQITLKLKNIKTIEELKND